MSALSIFYKRSLAACMAAIVLGAPPASGTEAIWHCSKHHSISLGLDPLETLSAAEEEDLFYLSSFYSEVISISLTDVADIFSERPVALGQLPLTGCFVQGESELNRAAIESIGLQWPSLQRQSRYSSSTPSTLRMVPHEDDMRACIVNNFPAVGYSSHVMEDEEVAPCF
jgi:hypothetical protein